MIEAQHSDTTPRLKITRPEDAHRIYVDAFNSGNVEAVLGLYELDATFVPEPGRLLSGLTAIGEAIQQFQSVGMMAAKNALLHPLRWRRAGKCIVADQGHWPGWKIDRGAGDERGCSPPSDRGSLAARHRSSVRRFVGSGPDADGSRGRAVRNVRPRTPRIRGGADA